MILFWLICALFLAIALAFVLPPLVERGDKKVKSDDDGRREANLAVYRDQLGELERDRDNGLIDSNQFELDRDELERRLLEDVPVAKDDQAKQSKTAISGLSYIYAIAIGIPLIAVAFYLRVGNHNALSPSPRPVGRSDEAAAEQEMAPGEDGRTQADIEANVAALAERLKNEPENLQGWIMLARSYMNFEKYAEASQAFAKASALKPDDAALLTDYAFALAMAGEPLDGKPAELVTKALKLDPENPRALQLAGQVAYDKKDYKLALEHWEKLMTKVPANSELGQALSEQIEKTKNLAAAAK